MAVFSFVLSLFMQESALDSSALIQNGPMVGYVEMMEAAIWVQTKDDADVHIVYWPQHQPEERAITRSTHTSSAEFMTATIILENLNPGTTYEYQVHVDSTPQNFPYSTQFKTQSFWIFRSDPQDFSVAMGSGFFVNDPPFDRPGKGYGGSPDIILEIHKKKPDFMLWLGDNVYFRGPEMYAKSRMNYRYCHDRGLPQLKAFLADTPQYAIWDDHDYGPNNSDRGYRMKDVSLDLFKAYWANPSYGTRQTPGVFTYFTWEDVTFFLTDNRYHRAPNKSKDPNRPFFGPAQLQWLKDTLISCRSNFKIIVGGNQMLNRNHPYERMSQFPGEYDDLINWLAETRINGVLFVSGDRHFSELVKIDREGLYPLYDFTCSPLTSRVFSSLKGELDNPIRIPGALACEERNFGLLKFSGTLHQRVLTIECIDRNGKLLWQHQIRAEDLRAPSQKNPTDGH